MSSSASCPLCLSTADFFRRFDKQTYLCCSTCHSIFLHPKHRLSLKKELKRYQLHENVPTDTEYQNFVAPIIYSVQKHFTPKNTGLDYGCGSGSAIAYILNQKAYDLRLFDPYFYPKKENLNRQYDYIICCEVMEHFYEPNKEFKKLFSLLKPKGKLIAKTSLLTPEIINSFDDWYYKNDSTHVFFYSAKTLKWIKSKYNFSKLDILSDHFLFTRSTP